jgi:hypothetical protein
VGYLVTVRQQSPQIRQSIERLSLRPAAYLRALPRWLPPVVIAALFIGGLAVRGWGGAAMLLVVTVFLAWLAVLSSPWRCGRASARRAGWTGAAQVLVSGSRLGWAPP